jgi:hypothetical protein
MIPVLAADEPRIPQPFSLLAHVLVLGMRCE